MTTFVDLYLRLSDGRDLSSLPARERALRREAARRSWNVHRVVVENDMAVGKSRNASAFKRRRVKQPDGSVIYRVIRPGFQSILEDLRAGRAQALLAEDLDRVVRDPRDGEDLLEIVELMRATADSLSEGALRLTNGGTDNEIYSFRGAVNAANKSSKDTARRVRDARERQADEGIWGGGRRPYGFTPVSEPDGKYQNTRLVIKEDEAREIRKAAETLLAGVTLSSISRDLNDRKMPTVTGTPWTPVTVRDVLLKPLNAGHVTHTDHKTGETIVTAKLPGDPILPDEVWQAVVAKLTDPGRRTPGGRAPRWIGSGIYHCFCGATMKVLGGNSRSPRYSCKLRNKAPGSVHTSRNLHQLDEYVGALVVDRLSRPDAAALVVAVPAGVDINELRAEQATLRQRKADLAVAFAEGEIDRAQMKAGTIRFDDKLAKVDYELSLQVDRSPLTPLINAEDVEAAWEAMSLGEKRAVIKDLMVVTVLPTQSGFQADFNPNAIRVEPR